MLLSQGAKAEITLNTRSGDVVYVIDMEKDVIEKMVFEGQTHGKLVFSYMQEVDERGGRFVEPVRMGIRRQVVKNIRVELAKR